MHIVILVYCECKEIIHRNIDNKTFMYISYCIAVRYKIINYNPIYTEGRFSLDNPQAII